MPHIPDTAHDAHDLELVAAFAAGDAESAGLEQATALVASCTECATLHHDLRAIAAALPELPAPVRSRDFRLTAEQAASLRPGGIRGLLAALSGPRFAFATPLGTGLAALGIVGVLVASGGFASGGSAGAAPAAAEVAPVTIEAAPDRQAASGAAASAAANGPAEAPAAGELASGSSPAAETPSAGVDTMGGEPAPSAAATAAPAPPESSKAAGTAGPSAPAPSADDEYLANVAPTPVVSVPPGMAVTIPEPEPSIVAAPPPAPELTAAAQPVQPAVLGALALVAVGLVLVSLRWVARRA